MFSSTSDYPGYAVRFWSLDSYFLEENLMGCPSFSGIFTWRVVQPPTTITADNFKGLNQIRTCDIWPPLWQHMWWLEGSTVWANTSAMVPWLLFVTMFSSIVDDVEIAHSGTMLLNTFVIAHSGAKWQVNIDSKENTNLILCRADLIIWYKLKQSRSGSWLGLAVNPC